MESHDHNSTHHRTVVHTLTTQSDTHTHYPSQKWMHIHSSALPIGDSTPFRWLCNHLDHQRIACTSSLRLYEPQTGTHMPKKAGKSICCGWTHINTRLNTGLDSTLSFSIPMHVFSLIYSDSQNWVNVWCLVLLDYSLNSFECKTYKKVLVHKRKNMIRAMQPSKNYVILIRGDEDMGNSNQGPIDSVLWDGIGTIRIWCSIYYITCNPW